MKKKKTPLKKSVRNRFSDWLLFLFLLCLPIQLGRHFFFAFSYINGVRVDYLAPTIYLTDIFVFFLLLANFQKIVKFFRQKAGLVVLALLLINVIFSQSKFLSTYQFVKFVELLIVFAVFSKTVVGNRLILIPFAFGALTEAILTIYQFIVKHAVQGVFYLLGERYFSLSTPGIAKAVINGVEFLRPYGTFSHPNSLAGFYLLVYFFVLTYKRFNTNLWLKNILLFLCSLLIFISFSKTAILTFFLLNTLYFILHTKYSCGLCLAAKIAVMTTLVLVVFRVQTDPLTVQKRLELIDNAVMIILRHPLFGTGIGTYLLSQGQFISRFNLFFNQPVHNIFLLFLAENGLLVGGIILSLLLMVLKKNWRYNRFIILVIVITGLLDHYWLTLQQNFLLMGVIMGFFANQRQPAHSGGARNLAHRLTSEANP